MSNIQKPILLVDGSAYLFRAFFTMRNMSDKDGNSTGAIYGVINMLQSLINDHQPEYMAVIFDPPGGSFRNTIYPSYKANRPDIDESLLYQIAPLYEILKNLGFPFYCVTGYEADDVIGTIAKFLSKNGHKVIVVTSDKDFIQIIDENISLLDTKNNKELNMYNSKDKFGVHHNYSIEFLAICGDSADNIPGAKGIGPKGAAEIINDIHSNNDENNGIDEIYNNLDKIKKDNLRKKLIESKDNVILSYKLATIKTDVDLDIKIEDLKSKEIKKDKALEYFKKLNFKKFINLLEINKLGFTNNYLSINNENYKEIEESKQILELEEANIIIIDDLQSLKNLEYEIDHLDKESNITIYNELSNINKTGNNFKNQINCYAITLKISNNYYYIPTFKNPEELFSDEIHDHYDDIKNLIKKILTNKNINCYCYNIKGLLHSINADYFYKINNLNDLMVISYTIDSTVKHDLDQIIKRNLDANLYNLPTTTKRSEFKHYYQHLINLQTKYASQRAYAIYNITNKLLESDQYDKSLYYDIEKDLWQILYNMEYNGILIDKELLNSLSKKYELDLMQLEKEAYLLTNKEFNLNSPKQISEILFQDLKLKDIKKGSTDVDVLEELSKEHKLPNIILEHRSLSKLKNTYTDALINQASEDNIINTNFQQCVVISGRLSSNDPNLQNIPVRTNSKDIRKAFIVNDNQIMLSADYSQIELRVMAELCQERTMLDAFDNDEDIHKITASEIFNKPLIKITSEERRFAKSINFGLIYGMGARGLSKQLNINLNEAKSYIELYFNKYKYIKNYIEQAITIATNKEYVETLFGRKIRIPGLLSQNKMVRAASERLAINAPIQGTAAEIIKMAMINLKSYLIENSDVKILLQVHDELLFALNKDNANNKAKEIKYIMEQAVKDKMKVKMKVDYKLANNWSDAH